MKSLTFLLLYYNLEKSSFLDRHWIELIEVDVFSYWYIPYIVILLYDFLPNLTNFLVKSLILGAQLGSWPCTGPFNMSTHTASSSGWPWAWYVTIVKIWTCLLKRNTRVPEVPVSYWPWFALDADFNITYLDCWDNSPKPDYLHYLVISEMNPSCTEFV